MPRCCPFVHCWSLQDTDKTREVAGSTEGIIAALQWCGMLYDEGVTHALRHTTAAHSAAVTRGAFVQARRL
jgi:hypothetical protein